MINRSIREEQSNNLYYRVKALLNRLLARKGAQNHGADVIRYQASTRASSYDFTIPPKGTSAYDYGYVYKKMKFTAAKTNVVLGAFRYKVFKGGTSNLASVGDFSIESQDLNFSNIGNSLRVGINAYYYTNTKLYVKAYAFATDSGVVEVEET